MNILELGLVVLTSTFSYVELEDYGATVDDGLSDLQALEDALDDFKTYNTDGGGHIRLRCGQYDFDDSIILDRTVTIEGPTGLEHPCAKLKFPADVPGILVTGSATTSTENASGSILRQFEMHGHFGADTAHGIDLSVKATIEHVQIRNFGGNGVNITADVNWTPITNANLFRINYCQFVNNAGWGVYIDGGDTNAGSISYSDFKANYTGQLYDSSFIGNYYVGNHFNGAGDCGDSDPNTRCDVFSDASAGSVFEGNYAEGSTELDIKFPSVYKNALGNINQVNNGVIEAHGVYREYPRQSWNLENTTEIRHGNISKGAGFGIEEWDAIDGKNRVRDPQAIRLGYEPNGSFSFRGWWCRYFNNAGGSAYICHATDQVEGTAERRGQLWFRGEGYWLGAGETFPHKRIFTSIDDEKPTRTDLPSGSFVHYYSATDTGTTTMGWLFNGVEWIAK